MLESAPHFSFWVRRNAGDGAVYSVRFEVEEGKGLLRVARPGVLVDPPARESGFEERLTPAQVRASRFLHVWDGGRKRQGYVLSRLTDDVLAGLRSGTWERMQIVSDGGFCWLVPGDHAQGDMMDTAEAVTIQPLPSTAARLLNSAPQPDPPVMPSLPSISPISLMPEPLLEVEPIDVSSTDLAPLDDPTGSTPAPVPPPDDTGALAPFDRTTTLVRYLRRQKLRDREVTNGLRSEVEALRKELAEAVRREAELRTQLNLLQRRLKASQSVQSK